MRIKRTFKKGMCYAVTFVMMFTMLFGMGTIESKAAGAQLITYRNQNIQVSDSDPVKYLLADGTAGTEDNYNVKFEYGTDVSTLTFKNLDVDLSGFCLVNGDGDIKIVLEGDNYITGYPSSAVMSLGGRNVTIGGSGSLNIDYESCSASWVLYAQSIKITDTAKVNIDISSCSMVHRTIRTQNDDFVMDTEACLDIDINSRTNECYAIYSEGAGADVSITGNADLDISICDYADRSAYGIYSYNGSVSIDTTKDLNIALGGGWCAQGINANSSLSITGTDVVINIGIVGSEMYGIKTMGAMNMTSGATVKVTSEDGSTNPAIGISANSLTMTGTSVIDIDMGSASQIYGLQVSGVADISDNSTIDVTVGDSSSQIYGVHAGNKLVMDDADINVKTGEGIEVYGIRTNALIMSGSSSVDTEVSGIGDVVKGVHTSNLEMSEDSTMFNIVDGDAAVNAFGTEATTFKLSDNANYSANVSGAKKLCLGIASSNFSMTDNTSYYAFAGDITDETQAGSLSSGLLISSTGTVSEFANIEVSSGTGESGYGICLQSGTMTVSGDANIKVTSEMNGFDKMPTLNTVYDFKVESGASSTTATKQNDTAKQTATTYTDNAYVLISPIDVISSVAVTDIDTPVAYGEFDTTATCATTGVKSVSSVWTLDGAQKQEVEPDTEYIVEVTLYPDDTHEFANTTAVTINGNQALTTTINNDGSLTATYKITATDTKLTAIENPADVTGIKNGTALANITLPAKVTIETAVGDMEASVTWDIANIYQGSYNPASKDAQAFTLKGTVTLPNGVDANGVVLAAYIKVTVDEGEQTTTTSATTEDSSTTTTEAKTDNTDGNVNTGDNSPIGIMLLLLGITCVGMAVVGKKNKNI